MLMRGNVGCGGDGSGGNMVMRTGDDGGRATCARERPAHIKRASRGAGRDGTGEHP